MHIDDDYEPFQQRQIDVIDEVDDEHQVVLMSEIDGDEIDVHDNEPLDEVFFVEDAKEVAQTDDDDEVHDVRQNELYNDGLLIDEIDYHLIYHEKHVIIEQDEVELDGVQHEYENDDVDEVEIDEVHANEVIEVFIELDEEVVDFVDTNELL